MTKFHFASHHDILLLKQIISDPPFLGSHGTTEKKWESCCAELRRSGIDIEPRTARDRFMLLMKKFKHDEIESLKKSGTNEEFTEKTSLLGDLAMLMREKELAKDKNKQEIKEKEKAQQIQQQAFENLTSPSFDSSELDSISTISQDSSRSFKRKRILSDQLSEYLVSRKEEREREKLNDISWREMQMEYNRERLELERERISMENRKLDIMLMMLGAALKNNENC